MAARVVFLGVSRLVSSRLTGVGGAARHVSAAEKWARPSAFVHTSRVLRCEAAEEQEKQAAVDQRDPSKVRDQIIPVETSIAYLQSEAFKTTYGDNPVWKEYRRNFKGQFAPPKTRKTCIRQNLVTTGNPCPVCRDEYLVLDYRNVKLLEHFICPHTGAVLPYTVTGVCRKRHQELLIAVEKARDCGYLTFDVPHRVYDYSDYIRQ